MGLNQRIIFTSHPKRRKRGASHFHQEFPSRNAEKAGGKTEKERKGSVGIAPALSGNRSGSSWESLRLSLRTLRDSAGPKPQQSAGARESHRHIPGTADPTRSRLAAPGDNCGVKGLPWASHGGFSREKHGNTGSRPGCRRLSREGRKDGVGSRFLAVPRGWIHTEGSRMWSNTWKMGWGEGNRQEKSRNLSQSGEVWEGEVVFPPVLLLQDSG